MHTETGKQIIKLNAVSAGHRSNLVPLPHEQEAFEAFEARMFESLTPRDAFQEELAGRMCSLTWRLRRFDLWERGRITTAMSESPFGLDLVLGRPTFEAAILTAREGETIERVGRLERSLHRQLLETWAALRLAQGVHP
jgi:hypothetical protein